VAAWGEPHKAAIDRALAAVGEIEASGEAWSFARLTLAHGALRDYVVALANKPPRRSKASQAQT
jgi:hypothetical protein